MIDKTQIAELRNEAITLDRMFKAERFIEKVLDQLEAAEARIAELESSLNAALNDASDACRARDIAEAEIAALRVAAVPVAYLYMGDETEFKNVYLAEDTNEDQAKNCLPLFTHPAPPVVAPHVQREFVNKLRDVATTYGKTQQLRTHLSKAVQGFIDDITVKSADSEGE